MLWLSEANEHYTLGSHTAQIFIYKYFILKNPGEKGNWSKSTGQLNVLLY